MDTKTVTLQIGTARIEVPAADIAQQILINLMGSHTPPAMTSNISPPPIGREWHSQGGIYAGKMRGEDGRDYHLVLSESEAEDIKWGKSSEDSTAKNERDGLTNTQALLQSQQSHPAAEWAGKQRDGGRADWYLPARRELALCYANVPELFDKTWYWSSTQSSSLTAWGQNFYDGKQLYFSKVSELRARAVRRVFDH
ncbi:DUF1566 domain-containing protein [Vreelandella alkaliphila]|uniref:DUF1566 domain-containing protein n=1 Tax=Vreelandella alkaliphila TaxID=272774 RepID=A0A7C9P121_9GAMM|nr:DUF1566 domain-containing protein [Halomonas alkaliphila]NDL70533.1 DUF1566 domain-containing protein [Halomonas alkaliphila]